MSHRNPARLGLASTSRPAVLLLIAVALTAATAARASEKHTAIAPDDLHSADGAWSRGPSRITPSSRYGLTAVYDAARRRMIVFGGFDDSRTNDVWVLSLAGQVVWTPLATAGTPPSWRYSHAAIYDPARDRMIVFGGDDGHDQNDVWALSLSDPPTWSRIVTTGAAPAERRSPSAIYDPDGDRMIVFGGKQDSVTFHGDCWSLSLGGDPTWTRLEPTGTAPSPRYRHSAIHDPVRSRMVVFAGDDGEPLRDLWALSLSGTLEWTQLHPGGGQPTPRKGHTAVYDPFFDRMVVYGGSDFDVENDTWGLAFASNAWRGLTGWNETLLRARHAALFDPVARRMVVFGGEGPLVGPQVLALGLANEQPQIYHWIEIDAPGWPTATVYDSERDRLVVSTSDFYSEQGLWTMQLGTTGHWTRIEPVGAGPSETNGHGMIFDRIRDRLILFGGSRYDGYGNTTYSNEVWILPMSGTPVWSRLSVPGGPSPRGDADLVYDPTRDRLIVIGGRRTDVVVSLTDTWALSLSGTVDWTRLATYGPLPTLIGSSAMYDPIRDRILVHGGHDGANWTDRTYTLALADPTARWTPLATAGPAPVTLGHTALYDPIRDRMVVFGGRPPGTCCPISETNQTWSLPLSGAPTWSVTAPTGPLPEPRMGHTAIYDSKRDRMIVYGGANGYDNSWVLEWGEPLRPGLGCADEVPTATGTLLPVRYPISNPIAQARSVEWRVTSERSWPGFPIHGTTTVGPSASETLTVQIPVPDSTEAGRNTIRLQIGFAGAAGNETECASEVVIVTTDVLASLVFAETNAERARLGWWVQAGVPVTVERRVEGGPWREWTRLLPDPRGMITVEDHGIEAGRRYGYRLSWPRGAETIVAGETWIDVPAAYALALAGARPNPVGREPMALHFTLPRSGPVTLEIYDVTGRRAANAARLDLDAGDHIQRMHDWDRLAPGLYVIRLGFEGASLRTRVLVAR